MLLPTSRVVHGAIGASVRYSNGCSRILTLQSMSQPLLMKAYARRLLAQVD